MPYSCSALQQGLGGSYNTAIDSEALRDNTGNSNTCVGEEALTNNSTGFSNVAMGVNAMEFNTTGNQNVSVGNFALTINTTGTQNTAIGNDALYNNTVGAGNTAVGYKANGNSDNGSQNTAVGSFSMVNNGAGLYNTAIGHGTLVNTTNAWYNTVLGYYAGRNFNMGYNNTILGANCDVNQAGLFKVVGIGQAVTNTASSQARIGNAATNSIGGYAGWTNISDGRFKKNIKSNVKGIDFIMRLNPVTYHLDISGISKILDEGRGMELDVYSRQAIEEKEKIIYSGFVAQEVEKAATETGYDFSGVDKPNNEKDFYGLRYAEFVVPLVKAVQEQQEIIQELLRKQEIQNKKIAALEDQYEKMIKQLNLKQ